MFISDSSADHLHILRRISHQSLAAVIISTTFLTNHGWDQAKSKANPISREHIIMLHHFPLDFRKITSWHILAYYAQAGGEISPLPLPEQDGSALTDRSWPTPKWTMNAGTTQEQVGQWNKPPSKIGNDWSQWKWGGYYGYRVVRNQLGNAGYGSMGRPSLAKRLAMTCKTSSLEGINIIWAIFAGHKPHNFEMWILCESWYAVESAQKQPISTHINLLPLGLSHIKWLEVVSRPRARFRFSILMLLHLTGYWFGSCFIAVRSVLLEGDLSNRCDLDHLKPLASILLVYTIWLWLT